MEISEVKNIIPEMKSVGEELISIPDIAKERINELEHIQIALTQSEQKENTHHNACDNNKRSKIHVIQVT